MFFYIKGRPTKNSVLASFGSFKNFCLAYHRLPLSNTNSDPTGGKQEKGKGSTLQHVLFIYFFLCGCSDAGQGQLG